MSNKFTDFQNGVALGLAQGANFANLESTGLGEYIDRITNKRVEITALPRICKNYILRTSISDNYKTIYCFTFDEYASIGYSSSGSTYVTMKFDDGMPLYGYKLENGKWVDISAGGSFSIAHDGYPDEYHIHLTTVDLKFNNVFDIPKQEYKELFYLEK